MAQISGDDRVCQYTASAGQTTFIYDFKIYDDDEVTVQQNGTTLTLTTDYTVTDAGEDAGGTIVLNSGATLNDTITITGNTIIARDTTFTDGGAFEADAINGEYNKLDDLVSELVTTFDKTVKLADYDASFDPTFTPTASRVLKINSGATGLEMSTYDPDTQVAAAAASAAAASSSASDAETAELAAEAAQSAAESARDEAEAAAASIDLDDLGSDIIPTDDSTYDLGSTAKRWAEIWSDDLTLTDDLTVGDDASVGGDLTVTGTSNLDGGIAVNTDKFTVNGTNGNTAIDGSLTVGGTSVTGNVYAQYQHNVAYNVDGGGSTASAWTKRTLDTEVTDNIGISLSSSVLTIPAGTYKVTGYSTHVNAAIIMLRLYDTTNSTVLVTGAVNNTTGDNKPQPIQGYFTLSGSTDVELQYYCTNALASTGLGVKSNANVGNNVYADLIFEKVG